MKIFFAFFFFLSGVPFLSFSEEDCSNPQPQPLSIQNHKHLQEDIWKMLGKVEKEKSPLTQENLIIPGERVGMYSLGTLFSSLSSLVPLQPPVKKKDPRYPLVLLLSEAVERDFRDTQKKDLTFAFSVSSQVVKEIFVRSSVFVTSDGFKVGISRETLQQRLQKKPRVDLERNLYFVMDGITFIVKNEVVQEIVVTEKLIH